MRKLLVLGVLLVAVLATWLWQRPDDPPQPRGLSAAAAAEPLALQQAQEPVGWVFGRLVGFPGAERPLRSGSGSGHPRFAGPPAAGREARR